MAVTRFLQLSLIDVLFGLALATLAVLYSGHIHTAGLVAIAMVLAVFCVGAAYALRKASRGEGDGAGHLGLAANICPAIGIAGVASGFLIALSGGTDDIQERVIGASSGLAATVVAVACMVVLDVQSHMLRPSFQKCRGSDRCRNDCQCGKD